MDAMVSRICEIIDARREEILDFARDILGHAELGFQETRTAQKFAEKMRSLDLPLQEGLAVTGVRAKLHYGNGPTVALLGEMDALPIPGSPYANPESGAAHCCGHHCQLTGVVGAALALTDPEIRKTLSGELIFFAVPAEEYIDLDHRRKWKAEGRIQEMGGKPELMRLGAFEDIDLAVTHHTGFEGIQIGGCASNGFVSRNYRITGKTAHAAKAPHDGVNALSAASLGLQALALNRETFRDEDRVRVHPVISRSSHVVNAVPDDVSIDTFVRAKCVEAIRDAAIKTDRSFIAGAMALGARCEVTRESGYLPCLRMDTPDTLLKVIQEALPGKYVQKMPEDAFSAASSDVGDLQHVKPVLSFKTGGATGGLHSDAFQIVDEEEAYIDTAKIFAIHAYELLKNGGQLTQEICASYASVYPDTQSYLKAMHELNEERKEV